MGFGLWALRPFSKAQSPEPMTVLITLHDVEPAIRLNAELEREGVQTEIVSPLDDVRGAIKRAKPDVIVVTGELTYRLMESIVKEQLWGGAPAIGLADSGEQRQAQRVRDVGYVDLFVKPIEAAELA